MKKLFALFAFTLMSLSAVAQTEALYLPTSSLSIKSGDTSIDLSIEFADEPLELATGLMFREGVPEGTGMLFDFGVPREANMYMRNVPFPIDMLFLNEEGDVMAIVAYVQPFSERIINPGFPVKGVLEIGAGQAKVLGLNPGDVVEHDMFGNVTASETVSEPVE